jgi:poly-gamma-glutamate capsule biosynthesis protein CapA/YwtB (metallophosphatase superfamily)
VKRTALIISLVLVGLISSYWIDISLSDRQQTETIPTLVAPDILPEAEEETIETITLAAAGDCLMHNTQIWSGLQPDGSHNFDTFFQEVEPIIAAADYSSTNFESPMAGPANGYAGYPVFNSPDEIAGTFKSAGFDMVVTANNHILDRGYQGALRTLEVLAQNGLDTVGVYPSLEKSQEFLIKDLKGIRVGYLGYTYSTNGIPVPADKPYLINFLDRDRILDDIRTLRPQVDILVLVLHWGIEYSPQPTEEQKVWAREFCEAGTDIILGSHPHVIQTMEVIPLADRNCFVIYSMGNFISHQRGLERNSGVILQMEFSKNMTTDQTVLNKVEYIPTYSHSYYDGGRQYFRVVPIESTIKKIEQGQESYLGSGDIPTLQAVLNHTRSQLGQNYYFH